MLPISIHFFYPVHERKDYAWDNLNLTVDNVLCHCPQYWTDLSVCEDAPTLRFCEDRHQKTLWKNTTIVRISLLDTPHRPTAILETHWAGQSGGVMSCEFPYLTLQQHGISQRSGFPD